MKREDYFKYRVQGGDIYVLPEWIFDELFDELLNLQSENKQLREVIEKENKALKEEKNEWIVLLNMFKKQQKEFIEYLEDEIKRLEENNIYQPLQRMALETYKHNLLKYKEIIGVKDEKDDSI